MMQVGTRLNLHPTLPTRSLQALARGALEDSRRISSRAPLQRHNSADPSTENGNPESTVTDFR